MCHAAVADSGEQHGRGRLAAGDGGGGDRQQPLPLDPVVMEATTAALPALSRGRQAREMSAMVAALARVVAGSAPPAKAPHQAVQEASAEEAWWPYDELVAEPSPAFVLDGKNTPLRAAASFSSTCMAAFGTDRSVNTRARKYDFFYLFFNRPFIRMVRADDTTIHLAFICILFIN
jgi:hypothetical protein